MQKTTSALFTIKLFGKAAEAKLKTLEKLPPEYTHLIDQDYIEQINRITNQLANG